MSSSSLHENISRYLPSLDIACAYRHSTEAPIREQSRAHTLLTMATPSLLPHLLLVLILILSAGPASNLSARIPEHSCHEQIHMSNCDHHKCSQDCAKHPNGVGHCKASTCFCTFFCKDPPV